MMAQVYRRSFELLQKEDSLIPIYLCPMLSRSLLDQDVIMRSKKLETGFQLIGGTCFEKYIGDEEMVHTNYCLFEE